jgi:endonuclease YncB( thermonuclease family)
MKKLGLLLIMVLSFFGVLSCTLSSVTTTALRLPNLSGMTEEAALQELAELPLTVTPSTIARNDLREGRFYGYGDGLAVGDVVIPGQAITVYFVIHENRLPDLTGKNYAQIFAALSLLDVIIEVQSISTNEIAEGLFVRYHNRLVGDLVPEGAAVIVLIAQAIIETKTELMISKYVEGSAYNRALEIYNPTDGVVDMSQYAIRIYEDGSETVYTEIILEGNLPSGAVHVLAHTLAEAFLASRADLSSANLSFNGNDTIALVYRPSGVMIDIIGTLGWGLFYLNDQTMVRNTLLPSATFVVSEWDIYAKDYVSNLGVHPAPYPTSFTFDSAFLAIPFSEKGGMVEVSFQSNYDGDTAYFYPGFLGENRVRFIGVDTPELNGGGNLAYAAKSFVYNRLNNANQIYLQHDPRSGNVETYGRYLALIWVDGVLLNWELVYYGYSQNNYQDETDALIFSGIGLSRWMTNAENRAKALRLGVWE